MVNSELETRQAGIRTITWAVGAYVVISLGTVIALVVLSGTAPELATNEAWGHAIVVAAFAVLLPLRLRSARRGRPRALRAVTVIAGALVVVNVVEAVLPGVFPAWMRAEMVAIAVLMLVVGFLAARAGRR
jgi:peptidoglycan/LPS O-acetylase OafA/YrhL